MKREMRFIRIAALLLGIAGAVLLIVACFVPTPVVHSREVGAAYAKYLSSPSEEHRHEYQDAVQRANRPLHLLQYASGLGGIVLLVVTARGFINYSGKQR